MSLEAHRNDLQKTAKELRTHLKLGIDSGGAIASIGLPLMSFERQKSR